MFRNLCNRFPSWNFSIRYISTRIFYSDTTFLGSWNMVHYEIGKMVNTKIMKTYMKIKKWFDLNLGWIFVNGRKREWWEKHLNEKYKRDI